MVPVKKVFIYIVIFMFGITACGTPIPTMQVPLGTETPTPTQNLVISQVDVTTTPLPTRPPPVPGELVDYTAQTGDTLANLAHRFNTTVQEILAANTFIPSDATTMPPGMPMKIPIYYRPFWGSQFQILPDSLFINGPAQIGFDTAAFISGKPGWMKDYREYAFYGNRTAAEIIDIIALDHSVSPRLLITLVEYQLGGLSLPTFPEEARTYPLGYRDYRHQGLARQLVWAANLLNNGYYLWRRGDLLEFEHLDGILERPDPWQNAASVAIQYYFSRLVDGDQYARAVARDGFSNTYAELFGDPWQSIPSHIEGSLRQPIFALPFLPGLTWAYTGGPHSGYGDGEPLAAIDFAPGALKPGCIPTDAYATAVAPGVVARASGAAVVLDLDGDGDERTGWVVFYFHIEGRDRVQLGKVLETGDLIGHPSCEGGLATGTHVHIARKYNGEWMPADSIVPFDMEGWVVQNGSIDYQGTLNKGGRTITACTCSDAGSQINATR